MNGNWIWISNEQYTVLRNHKPNSISLEKLRNTTKRLSMTTNLAQILLKTSAIEVYIMRVQIFQKRKKHLKILAVARMAWSKFHAEDQQILGATI